MEPSEPTHYEHHNENYASIAADAGDIFAFIDDHTRLASHMNKSSWMMGGSVRRLGRIFEWGDHRIRSAATQSLGNRGATKTTGYWSLPHDSASGGF